MTVLDTVNVIIEIARDRHITLFATGFAYYVFVAIIPLLLFALAVGSLLGGEELVQRGLQQVTALSPTGRQLLANLITNPSGRLEAVIIGLLVLAWSSLKVVRVLTLAFAVIYVVPGEQSFVKQLRNGGIAIITISSAFILLIVISFLIEFLRERIPLVSVWSRLLLFLGLVVIFFPLYYGLPPTAIAGREALPGTVVMAGGLLLLQIGFDVYLNNAGQYAAYGVLGTVLLFVTWLYLAGILLLLGAVVNAVLTDSV